MAAELVGGAFLSGSIQVLLERIASPEVISYLLGKKDSDFHGLLGRLKLMLNSVSAVLDDVEQNKSRNERTVEVWLDELQEAVFEAEDLLDEIETRASHISVNRNLSRHGTSNVNDQDLESRMKRMLDRLEYIAKQKDFLGLKEGVGRRERSSAMPIPSTSLVAESEVYGRDYDKEIIMKLLLSEDVGSDEKIGVIPIVGMGGIGKTTLAQVVYNHEEASEHFKLKAWVTVSTGFDISVITRTLLQSFSSSSYDDVKDLNLLQVKLKASLAGKKFLIVLDDVWNENYLVWESMRLPFIYGAKGSKIVVTTRSEKVASIMATVPSPPHHLDVLAEAACWQLFSRHAFGSSGESTANPNLEIIGREIVRKCGGLPLAVKALGGVLRNRDVGEWERVLKSETWDLQDNDSNILPSLRISYDYLPYRIKSCFLYASIFSKGYQFRRETLIRLWIAEGFLEAPKRNKRLEEVGDECFNYLLSASFFQRARTSDHHGSTFVMHDLMNDLAQSICKTSFFTPTAVGEHLDVGTRVRHFGYAMQWHDPYNRFTSVLEATHLRTFLAHNSTLSVSRQFPLTCYISSQLVHDVLTKLRCLRVLSLSGYCNIIQLPDSIGELIHLRSMDLSYTSINRLPESVCMLYNLQILNLRCCHCLTRLPRDFHHLINLRHLDVKDSGLKEMPGQISNLKSLQQLSTFIVGKEDGKKIMELGQLSDLSGMLSIKNLQNVTKSKDALKAKLREKENLEELEFEWGGETDDTKHERDVLENLQPDTSLEKLTVVGYGGTSFPNWLGDNSFCNIVFLHLLNCTYCNDLPPLGQLSSLKTLFIHGFDAVEDIGPQFFGNLISGVKPFPSLEVFAISRMPNWKDWVIPNYGAEAFPKLKELDISSCEKLTGTLPCLLPCLTRLKIYKCKQLAPSLPNMPIVCQLHVSDCENLLSQEMPETVKSLTIGGSRAVESSMFEALKQMGNPPEWLSIEYCSSLITLECLPTTLKTLIIDNCEKLEFPFNHSHMFLESLTITNSTFGSLRTFPLDSFPKLISLEICSSENLESLSLSNGSSQELTSLCLLVIAECPNLVSFPEDGLPAPKLSGFIIEKCEKLKFLPKKMHNLTSLQNLGITDCPEIELLLGPEDGFPLSLGRLHIKDCSKLITSRMNWKLQSLPKLSSFSIGGKCIDVQSFPEPCLLPTTITSLTIDEFSCLTTLDMAELQQFTSLRKLEITKCLNLRKMTEEELPNSLYLLMIRGCPLLEKRCWKENGKYWNKISHIPCIRIDDDIIS